MDEIGYRGLATIGIGYRLHEDGTDDTSGLQVLVTREAREGDPKDSVDADGWLVVDTGIGSRGLIQAVSCVVLSLMVKHPELLDSDIVTEIVVAGLDEADHDDDMPVDFPATHVLDALVSRVLDIRDSTQEHYKPSAATQPTKNKCGYEVVIGGKS